MILSLTTMRQNLTMGLKKGNTVLLYFTVEGTPGNKGSEAQHKLWKHVVPKQTEFAWQSHELAEAFCSSALNLDQRRAYGMPTNFFAGQSLRLNVMLDQLYWVGDSRTASELEVFINMPIEKLRVGCGLQCTLPHLPLGPSSRPLLFSAAVKLLRFALIK